MCEGCLNLHILQMRQFAHFFLQRIRPANYTALNSIPRSRSNKITEKYEKYVFHLDMISLVVVFKWYEGITLQISLSVG